MRVQDTSGQWHTMGVVESDMTDSESEGGRVPQDPGAASARAADPCRQGVRRRSDAETPTHGSPPVPERELLRARPAQQSIISRLDGERSPAAAAATGATPAPRAFAFAPAHTATRGRTTAAPATLTANAAAVAVATPRRVYTCRYTNCGKALSSYSNRSRHERDQHKGEEMNLVLAVSEMPAPTGIQIPPDTRRRLDQMMLLASMWPSSRREAAPATSSGQHSSV